MNDMLEISRVFVKYLRQETLSSEEVFLLQLFLRSNKGKKVVEQLRDTDRVLEDIERMKATDPRDAWQQLSLRLKLEEGAALSGDPRVIALPVQKPLRRRWYVVAAAALLLLAIPSVIFYQPRPISTLSVAGQPGGNKAILTLAGGQRVDLGSTVHPTITEAGNVLISNPRPGQLYYPPARTPLPATMAAFNTLSTPRAGQYALTLPDGTRAWLNNASALKYPLVFPPNGRQVDLWGEVYFEIASDPQRPFRIVIHHTREEKNPPILEVLGTRFNVAAYDNEPVVRATLVDGSIRLVANGTMRVLQPSEQAVIGPAGAIRVDPVRDAEVVIAWKDGYFNFYQSSLQETLRQIARWYDVDVDYRLDSTLDSQIRYQGKIERYKTLDQLLDPLRDELAGKQIAIRLEGRRLVVGRVSPQ